MITADRLNLRLSPEDLANVRTISDALRRTGAGFPTRADAARAALELAARTLATEGAAATA